MANIDLTKIPAKVTITNVAKDEYNGFPVIASDADKITVEDGATKPGAVEAVTAGKASETGSKDFEVQLFGKNIYKKLAVGDTIEMVVETSAELLYWVLQGEKFADIVKVDVEEIVTP